MEPEWNNPDCYSDSVMLGLRCCESNKHNSFLKNRVWSKRFSFRKRKCFISGENITWSFSYVGRKQIKSVLNGNKILNDDIWLSQKSFDNLR